MPGERIVESFGAACSRFLRSFKLFEPELPPGVVWKKKASMLPLVFLRQLVAPYEP